MLNFSRQQLQPQRDGVIDRR